MGIKGERHSADNQSTSSSDVSSVEGQQSGPNQTTPATPNRDASLQSLLRFVETYALAVILVFMTVVFSLLLPETFATRSTFVTMASTVAVSMILALALIIPLSAGDFDLSVAAILGLSAGVLGKLTTSGVPLLLGVACALLIGIAIGAINGFFVVKVGVNAFITTLATATVLEGLSLAVLDSQTLFVSSNSLSQFARFQLFNIPLPVYYGLILAAILWALFDHTPTGRRIYMTGEGTQAARLSGIRTDRIRFGAFLVAGLLSAFAGIIVVGQLGASDPGIGPPFLLPAFAAAFLGSTTIKLGRFNVWGTVLAVYFVEVGITGFQLLGAESWITQVFNGTVLVAAVTFARIVSRNRGTG